jgi:hypothetical protein
MRHIVDGALQQMARFLARLHTVDPGTVSAPGLTQIEDPVTALPRYLPADETGFAIDRALERGVLRRPNADVLLHGDFWPGNVMFNGGEIAAVLDWEDAAYGDPLVDLACARLELTCAYGSDASERFTAHYLECSRQLAACPCSPTIWPCGTSTSRQQRSRRCTSGACRQKTRLRGGTPPDVSCVRQRRSSPCGGEPRAVRTGESSSANRRNELGGVRLPEGLIS